MLYRRITKVANNNIKHPENIRVKPSIKMRHELGSFSAHQVVIPSHLFTAMPPRLTDLDSCHGRPDGNYPCARLDGSNYFSCYKGLLTHMTCENDLCYNPFNQQCQQCKYLFLSLRTITSLFDACEINRPHLIKSKHSMIYSMY